MWFVFASLGLKISLIAQNLYPTIQTDLFMRTGTVFEEYSSCCRSEFGKRSHLECCVHPRAPEHEKGPPEPTYGREPSEGLKMIRELEHLMNKARLTERGLFSLEKRGFKRDFMNVDKNLMRESRSWILGSSQWSSKRRGNTQELKCANFHLNTRK